MGPIRLPTTATIARTAHGRRECRNDWPAVPRSRTQRRVCVDVLVRVKMRQSNPFRSDAIDLRGQLPLDLIQRDTTPEAGDDERFPRPAEPSVVLYQRGDAAWRERRRAIDESQMDADAEGWSGPNATNRIDRGCGIRKKDCARQDAAVVGL